MSARGAVLAVACALAAAGCAGPPEPTTEPDLEPGIFTLGYAAVDERDRQLVRAAQLAVETINAGGGVGGAVRLELVVDEEGGEPGNVARRLALRGVQALVLACDPEAMRAQADVADRTQVLSFAPCNEDPTIVERYPIVWPVSLGANAEAAALADYALAQRLDAFRPVGVWPEFMKYLAEAAAARGIELGNGPALGTHRVEGEALGEGIAFTAFGFPSAGSSAATFYERFEAEHGEPPAASWVALGWDAVAVAAAAIASAGDPDPAAVMARLDAGLAAEGALGEIVYPGGGAHQPEVAVAVVEVEGGKRVLAERSLPEDVPAP